MTSPFSPIQRWGAFLTLVHAAAPTAAAIETVELRRERQRRATRAALDLPQPRHGAVARFRS